MQRTIRFLRVLLPILFVLFVALVVMSFTRRNEIKNPQVDGPKSPRTGRANFEAMGFDETQTLSGKVVSRIRARRVVGIEGGWYTFEEVILNVYRSDGTMYELQCPNAQFNAETKEADVSGGVKVTSGTNVEIITEEMNFDGKRLVNRIPVTYRVDEWSGRAGGIDVDVDTGELKMTGGFLGVMKPVVAGEPDLSVTSQETVFQKTEGRIHFTGGVSAQRGPDSMHSSAMVAGVDQKQRILTSLEGTGTVRFVVHKDPSATGQSLTEDATVTADRFTTVIEAGRIRAFDVMGDSNSAHAILSGPPPRELDARHFRVDMDPSGVVTSIGGDGDFKMVEVVQPMRTIRSQRASVLFENGSRTATRAIVEGNATFEEGGQHAEAERVNYDIVAGTVVLTALPNAQPTLTTPNESLKANVIEISPKKGTLKGTGQVTAKLNPRQRGTPTETAVFPGAQGAVFVNADSAFLQQQTKSGVFTGHVRAWQETNTLFSDELHIQNGGEVLLAKGNVRTVLYNTRPAEGGKAVPMMANADLLTGRKTARVVELEGNVKIDDGLRTLASQKAIFRFDANRKLDRVDASEGLAIEERVSGRKGSGDRAVYQLAQRLLLLYGSPAEVSEPRGTMKGQEIAFDLARNKVDVVSRNTPTETTYNPE